MGKWWKSSVDRCLLLLCGPEENSNSTVSSAGKRSSTQTEIRMIKQKTSVISLLSNKQCQYLPVQAWSSSALPKAS